MTVDPPKLGTSVQVTPLDELQRGRWAASCDLTPPDWHCVVVVRGREDIEPLRPISGWIFDIVPDETKLIVSLSDFGFRPISDRMRPRYIGALRCLGRAFRADDLTTVEPEDCSTTKGMFSRCHRKDQWDWCAVRKALGEPGPNDARRIAGQLGDLGRALRTNDTNAAIRHFRMLRDSTIASVLERAAEKIEKTHPVMPANRFRSVDPRPTDRHADIEHSPTKMHNRARTKLAEANASHAMVLDTLTSCLRSFGLSCRGESTHRCLCATDDRPCCI